MLTQDKVFLKLLIFLLIAISMNAQSETELNVKIDSVDKIISLNKNKIENLKKENVTLLELRDKYSASKNRVKIESLAGRVMICKAPTTIFNEDSISFKEDGKYEIRHIYFGDPVEILDLEGTSYKVKFNGKTGYISKESLASKEEFNKIPDRNKENLYKAANLFRNAIKNPSTQIIKTKEDRIIEKYGKVYGPLIYNNQIAIGMTKKMVIESIGSPNDINKTIGSWGVHEQWVYLKKYLYFENGKLTSWQE